jgi:hypothetical protein
MTEHVVKRLETKFGEAQIRFNGFAPLSFFIEVPTATINGVVYSVATYRGTYNAHTNEVTPCDYSEPHLRRSDWKDASIPARKAFRTFFDEAIRKLVTEDAEFMAKTADALHNIAVERLSSQIEEKRAEREKLTKEIGELEEEQKNLMLAGPPTL